MDAQAELKYQLDLICDLVAQGADYGRGETEGFIGHMFMSVYEEAFFYLVERGKLELAPDSEYWHRWVEEG